MAVFRKLSVSISTLLLVAACSGAPPPGLTGIRDQGASMSSIALLDYKRIQGLWHEVAGFPLVAGCRPSTVGMTIELTGSNCYLPVPRGGSGLMQTGSGRLRLSDGTELWVLWVDADYRTLVIGDPSGRFGAILNRDVSIPPDRLRAAKEVLVWNGYDVSKLAGA